MDFYVSQKKSLELSHLSMGMEFIALINCTGIFNAATYYEKGTSFGCKLENITCFQCARKIEQTENWF